MVRLLLRAFALSTLAAGVMLAGYWVIMRSADARLIAELEAMNEEMAARLAEKEAMLERLARERRIAHIEVLEQPTDASGQVIETTVRFIELDDRGAELARQTFTVPGDVLFIDAWTAKFSQHDVAIGHPMRGRTLVLLRRIYSDRLAPRDGVAIDTPGAVPAGYAATEVARFEQLLWERFWEIADDPALATEMGVRVAQGEVVYKPVREGRRYELVVDASGGINLTSLQESSDYPLESGDQAQTHGAG